MSGALLVYGAGGHGKVVVDAALAAGWNVHGYVDDRPERLGARVLGLPVLVAGRQQAIDYCRRQNAHIVVAVGDNRARAGIYRDLTDSGIALATIVHPSAVVAASARVGQGTVIFANAVVNAATEIGVNAILNTAAAVDHDSRIGDHVHLAPGARTGGTVTIGEGTMLGIGTCVRNNTAIGRWSMVGMGSVVVGDLPDSVLAYGNPARVQRPY